MARTVGVVFGLSILFTSKPVGKIATEDILSMNLTLYGSSLLRFEIDLFTVFRKIFQSFLKIKFESSNGLGHIFDFVSCIPDEAYVPMSNFSCHSLIDGLLTNQIALLLPVRGRTEFGKMFGIKAWFTLVR